MQGFWYIFFEFIETYDQVKESIKETGDYVERLEKSLKSNQWYNIKNRSE